MPEIRHNELQEHISGLKTDSGAAGAQSCPAAAPVYLIFGDEYLAGTAFEILLEALLPGSRRSLNFTPFDGAGANIFEVIEQMNTFSFMAGIKVVALRDARIFYTRKNDIQLLEKALEACREEAFQKAAGYFAGFLSLLNFSGEDLRSPAFRANFNAQLSETEGRQELDEDGLDGLIQYAVENDIAIPPPRDDAQALRQAIEKAFPPGII